MDYMLSTVLSTVIHCYPQARLWITLSTVLSTVINAKHNGLHVIHFVIHLLSNAGHVDNVIHFVIHPEK